MPLFTALFRADCGFGACGMMREAKDIFADGLTMSSTLRTASAHLYQGCSLPR